MEKNIKINRISYTLEFGNNSDVQNAQIQQLVSSPFVSYVETSYNSLALVCAEGGKNGNSYQYNYLMYIDEYGYGYPINSIVNTNINIGEGEKPIICIYPRIEFNTVDYGRIVNISHDNSLINQGAAIAEMSATLNNVVNVLNNDAVRGALGLLNNTETSEELASAVAHQQQAAVIVNSMTEKLSTARVNDLPKDYHSAEMSADEMSANNN